MNRVAITDDRLLELHQLHLGLYARLGRKLQVTPGYVSRVASGKRQSEKVKTALVKELRRLSDSTAA
jgi:hypothetical protein